MLAALAVTLLVAAVSVACAPGDDGERARADVDGAESLEGSDITGDVDVVDSEEKDAPPELLGEITWSEIERAVPEWGRRVTLTDDVAEDTVSALTQVEPGSELQVFLGTWCGDSRREVSRFEKITELAGGGEPFPFDVTLIGVDGDKAEPAALLEGQEIHFVPTFVVRRDGQEVGRVVESAETTLENDLLRLLTGEATGVLTGRADGAVPPTGEGS